MADGAGRSARLAQLSPAKRALLERRLRGEGASRTAFPSIPRRHDGTDAPLSFAQERLWYLDQLEPNAPIYTVRTAYRLTGDLNVPALRQSFQQVLNRHEALRTTFPMVNGVPVQRVSPSVSAELPLLDLRQVDLPNSEAALIEVLGREGTASFDLARGPLFRAQLLRLDDREHVLVIVAHHTIIDGWSLSILRRELVTGYESALHGAEPSIPTPPIQYGDYAAWQRKQLQGGRFAELLGYWREELGGELPVLEMPSDRPRPPIQSYRGTAEAVELDRRLVDTLSVFARSEDATLFMVLLAAAAAAMARYSGQEEILFGSPVANRELPELEHVIGLFVNVLVLRVRVGNGNSFRDLLRDVRDTCVRAYSHQEMPFERLVQELRPERDLSRTPLFQALFAFQDTSSDPTSMGAVTWEPVRWHPPVARTDLAFWLEAHDGRLTGALEYSTDLFDAPTVTRFLRHYLNLLSAAVTDPDRPVAELSMLSAEERRRMLVDWNGTARAYPTRPVHALVEQQASRTPERVAVVFDGVSLSYDELNSRSNQLAHHLAELRVGPGTRVGIMLDRSAEMVVTVLGVLKSGATYVPLDPEFPAERLGFMARDAELEAVITERSQLDLLPQAELRMICLADERTEIDRHDPSPPNVAVDMDDLAYVIYTSGSTGRPKGVEVRHRGVVNFLSSMQREPGLGPQDVLVAVTTLSFDIAVLELLLPLIAGAQVVMASRDQAADGRQLSELLERSGATVMQATPATWRLLIEAGWKGGAEFRVLCGGEALDRDLARDLLSRAGAVWNMYGPTETTVWSTCYRLEGADAPILIGRPIANTTAYVLDDAMQPVPAGVPGELYIGGAGLARGYWKRPELTRERFVPDRFSDDPTAKLYRTGDWVRFTTDGTLEYLRRIDNQIKLRGYRIELGEIEAALGQHSAVGQAVATVRTYGQEDRRLVAYLVPSAGMAEPTGTELRSFLRDRLPSYMVPSLFVNLEAVPLTPNGKVDRKALPEPGLTSGTVPHVVPPRTPMERIIAEIWRSALGLEDVSVRDNFFDLGGHSLLSMQVIGRIEDAVGVRLGAREMVLQTLGQIAAHCEAMSTGGDGARQGLGRRLLGFLTGRREAADS